MSYPRPDNDDIRVARVQATCLLDTAPSPAFDMVVKLASERLGTPMALISLIDSERQWLKSCIGIPCDEFPREQAFCSHTICRPEPMIIPDARLDARFADNPFVLADPPVLAYAGIPLTSTDGLPLGTLCAIDAVPRAFDESEIAALNDLATIANELIVAHEAAERARIAEMRLIDAVEALSEGFVLYDRDDRLLLCNGRFREIHPEIVDALTPGAHYEDILRHGLAKGAFPEARGCEDAWMAEHIEQRRTPKGTTEAKLPDSRWIRVEESPTREGGIVGFRIDITELKHQQHELEQLAATDPLTGMSNRRQFYKMLAAEAERSRRAGQPAALLVLDVDHFKRINDTFGHSAGDAVLVDLARTIAETLRPYDQIGRLGGEEFAVLMPRTTAEDAVAAGERLRAAIADAEVIHGDARIQFTASIGVTPMRCTGTDDIEPALERADHALYEVKGKGRNAVAFNDIHGATRMITPDALVMDEVFMP